MKYAIKLILIILAFSGQFSCVKVLDYEIPNDEKKIVINSYFSANDTFVAYINKSMHILDKVPVKYLNDAEIQLFEDDIFLTEIKNGINGKYHKPVPFKNGHQYKIIVTHPGLKQASATTIIPMQVDIIKVDTSIKNTNYDFYSYQELNCDISFNDPFDIENYYELRCYNSFYFHYLHEIKKDSFITVNVFNRQAFDFLSDDIIIEQAVIGDYFNTERTENNKIHAQYVIFSDRLINGKNHIIPISLSTNGYGYQDSLKIEIELRSVTRDYYLYMQALEKHFNVRNDPLSEPVLAYSNVENGLGLFSGYSVSKFIINLDTLSHNNQNQ